jgi:hypothetical protein
MAFCAKWNWQRCQVAPSNTALFVYDSSAIVTGAKLDQGVRTCFRVKQLHHVIGGGQMEDFKVIEVVFQQLFLRIAGDLSTSRIKPQDWGFYILQKALGVRVVNEF